MSPYLLLVIPVLVAWMWRQRRSRFDVRDETTRILPDAELMVRILGEHASADEWKESAFPDSGHDGEDLAFFRLLHGRTVARILFSTPTRPAAWDGVVSKLQRSLPKLNRSNLLVLGAGDGQQVLYELASGGVLVVHLAADAVFRYESGRDFLSAKFTVEDDDSEE